MIHNKGRKILQVFDLGVDSRQNIVRFGRRDAFVCAEPLARIGFVLDEVNFYLDNKLILNRLADLLWVLARAAEQAEARSAPPSRPDRRRTAATRSER